MNKKENNEKILKSIIIMRHGERIDCIDSQKDKQLLSEYDPELTEKGIKQAKDIGNQIKKSIKKGRVTKFSQTIYLAFFPFRYKHPGPFLIIKIFLKFFQSAIFNSFNII